MSGAWAPEITRDEFLARYTRGGVSAEWLREHGRDAFPCNCEYPECRGWMAVNAEDFAADLAMWEAGDGPPPSKLTADEWARYRAAGDADGVPSAARVPKLLTPFMLPNCTTDDWCEEYAIWALGVPGDPHWDGEACCDSHVPAGWVRPDSSEATS